MLRKLWPKATPSIPAGQRIYAVGDVHGRADLLEQLLVTIERDNFGRPAADVTVILLGDLIDRGPASRRVVGLARDGVAWARTVALMGNHEAIMLDAMDGKRDTLESWLRFGGRQTLESWGVPATIFETGTLDDILCAARSAVAPEELAWFSRLRCSVRIGGYYFVHAGVRPGIPLEQQATEDCLWIRDEFLDSKRSHGAVVVHGHSIQAEVEDRPNRIGLDTGAYITGRLAAAGFEGANHWFLSAISS
jgi:serine/threonine protein phosphatase 1